MVSVASELDLSRYVICSIPSDKLSQPKLMWVKRSLLRCGGPPTICAGTDLMTRMQNSAGYSADGGVMGRSIEQGDGGVRVSQIADHWREA